MGGGEAVRVCMEPKALRGGNFSLRLLDDAHNYTVAAANARQLLTVHNATLIANLYGTDSLQAILPGGPAGSAPKVSWRAPPPYALRAALLAVIPNPCRSVCRCLGEGQGQCVVGPSSLGVAGGGGRDAWNAPGGRDSTRPSHRSPWLCPWTWWRSGRCPSWGHTPAPP